MDLKYSFVGAMLALALLVSAGSAAEKTTDSRVVKDGQMVSLHYTLTGADGKVIETSKDKEPLKYIHGQKMMIPGLERELAGMKIGGEKTVTVKPEDGYGPVDKNAFQEVPRDKLPANGLKVGAMLTGQGPQGQPMQARVHEIKEKTVVLDLNHPMAGKTLKFDVKVVDIQPPPPTPAANPATPAPSDKTGTPGGSAKPAEPGQKK
jgi:FKBP-type peptidyl-prolyl cis-trans isomerase SlyD